MPIDIKSIASHQIVLYAYARAVGTGTAFVVRVEGIDLLVTNYHVVSGRHPDTGKPLDASGVTPDRVLIPFVRPGSADLRWGYTVQRLVDDGGAPLWVEHPIRGRRIDVVVLPVRPPADCVTIPYPLEPGPDVALPPASDLAIIGFPEGMAGSGITAIWKAGTIASEPDLADPDRQWFWIDSNTRKGMSGSPVVARRFGGALMADGNYNLGTTVVDRTIGVYAGRAFDAPDMTLGRVWKWDAVQEVVNAGRALVQRGILKPQVTTIGYIQTEQEPMVKLDVSRSVNIPVQLPTGAVENRPLTLGNLLREFALTDDRFGHNLQRVKLAAAIDAAITEAEREGRAVELEDGQYSIIREVIEQPSKAYNAAIARHLLPLLEYVMDAGAQ